jgi:hypothetical protein
MNGVFDLNDGGPYGDSDFLASRDAAIGDFRDSEKVNKRKIIEKMLTLRHNMKYNKHLLSVYMKAKGLFDKMVEEHRSQLYYLDEIYRHINQLIRENLSTSSKKPSGMITELIKDKKRIGALLKRMRASYENLMNVDTVLGVTIDKINEISFMDEDDANIDVDDGVEDLDDLEDDDGDDDHEDDDGGDDLDHDDSEEEDDDSEEEDDDLEDDEVDDLEDDEVDDLEDDDSEEEDDEVDDLEYDESEDEHDDLEDDEVDDLDDSEEEVDDLEDEDLDDLEVDEADRREDDKEVILLY